MNQQEALWEDEDGEYKPEVAESGHLWKEKGNLEMVRQEEYIRH